MLIINETIEDIERISLKLLLSEPFYAHILLNTIKSCENVGTACISLYKSNFSLKVDPNFWTELNDDEKRGIMKHEILHTIFKHIFMIKKFHDKKLFNIAADLSVNQHINSKELPEGAILLKDFPDFKHNETVQYYYDKLTDAKNELNSNTPCDSKEKCNSTSLKTLKKLLGQDDWDEHKWEEEFSDELEEILENKIDKLITDAQNKIEPGKLPGFYKGLLENVRKPPIVSWKNYFKTIVSSSHKSYIKNTIHRVSRRYGTNPGIKIKTKAKILIAVDTSGSVRDEDLKDFFSEIYHIWKSGVAIRILEVDTKIQHEWDYKGENEIKIHGRGGTIFQEPFDYALIYKPNMIIYLTDGYGGAPKITKHINTLWIISTGGIDKPEPSFPGKFLFMRNK